jgi:hypothetical protein
MRRVSIVSIRSAACVASLLLLLAPAAADSQDQKPIAGPETEKR